MLDWFFNFFDQIAQNMVWQSIFAHFNWVDGFAMLFMILGIAYGLQKGLMSEIAEIFEICVVITLTHEFYVKLDYFLRVHFRKLPEEPIAAVSFILTGSIVWLIIGIAASQLKKLVHTQMAPLLRLSGGVFLGVIHLLLIYSFISQAVLLMPMAKLKTAYDVGNSTLGPAIARLSPKVHRIVTQRSLE